MEASSIDCSFLQGLLRQDAAPADAAHPQVPKQADFQGRRVEQEHSQAHKITLSPKQQAGVVTAASAQLTEQCQKQPRPLAPKPPELVRQARYPALPSHGQLLGLSNTQANTPRLPPLASCAELIASAGPAKSYTLLERFLNLILRRDKSSRRYNSILKSLQTYHDACLNGNCKQAQAQLKKLARLVDRHLHASDANPQRAQMFQEFREQISDELTALTSLAAEWDATPRPEEIQIPHALAFACEGVSLAQMLHLYEQGLKLDQVKMAREIVESQKQSTASAQSLPEGYLAILAALQKYHSVLERGSSNTDKAQALSLLKKLQNMTTQYVTRHQNHAQLKPFQELLARIAVEHIVVKGLLAELNNGGTLPEGAKLAQALAFAREGVSLKDMARLMSRGLQADQAVQARELLDSERVGAMLAEKIEGFSEAEISLLGFSGLGTEGGQKYQDLGLPINRQTITTQYAHEQRLGELTPLGKGALNQVYSAHYLGPDGLVEGVFKPLQNSDRGWAAEKIGINIKSPKTANRNLATQAVARALGFDVLVNSQIGTYQRILPSGESELHIGLVMDRAQGQSAHQTPLEHFYLPEVQREITKLQLLDHLTGQGDRHHGNYFIHVEQDKNDQTKVKVSGIDNDQCFGKNTQSGNDIGFMNTPERLGFRGTFMPKLIDTDMAAAINQLTEETLTSLLSDKLDKDEVHAACARLRSLQQHVARLKNVINPSLWGKNTSLAAGATPTNSYFVRDEQHARAAARQAQELKFQQMQYANYYRNSIY